MRISPINPGFTRSSRSAIIAWLVICIASFSNSPTLASASGIHSNVLSVISVTSSEMQRTGFLVTAIQNHKQQSVSKFEAANDAKRDFPARGSTQILSEVLVNYKALRKYFEPPFNQYVPCWAVIMKGSVTGLPIVTRSVSGTSWTLVLINCQTGALQGAFVGKSKLR